MSNPDGSADANVLNYYETSSNTAVVLTEVDGRAATAPIKITSLCKFFTLVAKLLKGGRENVIDINHDCDHVVVTSDVFEANGKYALSAKTSSNVQFFGKLTGSVTQWWVNLGSWSDQSWKIQEDTYLQLTADSYPITVWMGNARRTTFDEPSKYKVIFKVPFCDVPYLGVVTLKVFIVGWWAGKKLGFKI